MASDTPKGLTSSSRLTNSALWSLTANLLPLAVAFVCIPILIDRVGVERFGVLALVWALIGYASLFDLGLGRALTKVVAERIAQSDSPPHAVIWTGLGLSAAVGVLGALLLWAITPWLAGSGLRIDEGLQGEAVAGFRLVALAVPLVTLTVGLRGIFEAHQRFRTVALVEVLAGMLNFLGPLAAVAYSTSIPALVAALVAVRGLSMIAYTARLSGVVPGLSTRGPERGEAGLLLRLGSWMSVDNLVGPVMDYLDRFIVGGMLSIGAVTFYATPFDAVMRMRRIPGAVTAVLFPALATTLATDRARAESIYSGGLRSVVILLAAPLMIVALFARELLSLWLGTEFGDRSEAVVQWLAVGLLVNAMALVPHAALQAAGRPDVIARLHVLELPVFLLAVWYLVSTSGIVGAAIAWTLRASLDALILFYLCARLVGLPTRLPPRLLTPCVFSLVFVGLAPTLEALVAKVAYAVLGLALMGVLVLRLRWLGARPLEVVRAALRPGR
ncbi:MAG: flippase [Thermoanaerobaculia bacterium]|nr:flippase [Thermoanaerobaculia bacterium]